MDNDVYRIEIEHANRRWVTEPDNDQTTRELVAKWVAAIQAEQLSEEKLTLIRLLRDQTHSKDIYDRCVAIVGRESAP